MRPNPGYYFSTVSSCAFLHAEELAAILGEEYHPNDSILILLQRHFRVRVVAPLYAARIQAVIDGDDNAWENMAQLLGTTYVPITTGTSQDSTDSTTDRIRSNRY